MSLVKISSVIGIAVTVMMAGRSAAADGNAEQGRMVFRVCAACHSVEKGVHRTGPSLAKIWGQKAGTIEGFRRYSKALKTADVEWDDTTLDQWLTNPRALIPGNRMIFRGMDNGVQRADLIAFLKLVSEGGPEIAGGMQGGMMGQRPLNLKGLEANNQVTDISYCPDTYDVSTANGETHQFWEFNLRFKTDSSENGPARGAPAIIPGGMGADRAYIIFTSPEEISTFIKRQC